MHLTDAPTLRPASSPAHSRSGGTGGGGGSSLLLGGAGGGGAGRGGGGGSRLGGGLYPSLFEEASSFFRSVLPISILANRRVELNKCYLCAIHKYTWIGD